MDYQGSLQISNPTVKFFKENKLPQGEQRLQTSGPTVNFFKENKVSSTFLIKTNFVEFFCKENKTSSCVVHFFFITFSF
jgi:hypothetical protein